MTTFFAWNARVRSVRSVRAAMTGTLLLALAVPVVGASLTGSSREIARNSAINLSTNGTIDWVHWGLYTESSLNRKAGAQPLISDFSLLDNTNGFVFGYQYSDNYNGYTWSDGDPVAGVTNTTTGVWAYGIPFIGTGFQITVPAATSVRTLKVYCGVFAGTGRLQASLSDESAPDYTTTFSHIPGGGESHEVTLRYAASSPGQHLTVRWVLQTGAGMSPNVTLQAAALSAEGVNNPPVVRLTSPSSGANLPEPGDVALTATASDLDGTVANVEFFANGQKVGQDDTSPYTAVLNNPAPGHYSLTAIAADNGGETSTSAPIDITVYQAGGNLAGSMALPPTAVNLTAEGTADWQHWGASISNLVNRKAGTLILGELDFVGSNVVNVLDDYYTGFSWSDGTPVPQTNNLRQGVFVYGRGNGFEFTVPADTTSRRLRVYAGLYGCVGHFQAWLTDFSAPTFHNHSLSNSFGNDYGVFTLDFVAASAGQSLVVRYLAEALFDSNFGNVTMEAVTLQGGSTPPLPVRILDPVYTAGNLRFSFSTQAGRSYAAQWQGTLGPSWQTFATVAGTGELVSVTNQNTTGSQRFYRVETE